MNTRVEGFKDDAGRIQTKMVELTASNELYLEAVKSAPRLLHASPEQLAFIASLQSRTATITDGLRISRSSEEIGQQDA
jgi:hypothetical protein